MSQNPYDAHLGKTPANYQPLTPLSSERSAAMPFAPEPLILFEIRKRLKFPKERRGSARFAGTRVLELGRCRVAALHLRSGSVELILSKRHQANCFG